MGNLTFCLRCRAARPRPRAPLRAAPVSPPSRVPRAAAPSLPNPPDNPCFCPDAARARADLGGRLAGGSRGGTCAQVRLTRTSLPPGSRFLPSQPGEPAFHSVLASSWEGFGLIPPPGRDPALASVWSAGSLNGGGSWIEDGGQAREREPWRDVDSMYSSYLQHVLDDTQPTSDSSA